MIQRLIYTALRNGLDAIAANPLLLEDLFVQQFALDADEIEHIKQVFATTPPDVVHGYARSDNTFPLYAITLADEHEAETFINDSAGQCIDSESQYYQMDLTTAVWEHTYHVHCYAEHPDVCSYIYEAAKSILLLAHPYFTDNHVFEQSFSGLELAPDPRYVPEHLFLRQLTMKCQREFLQYDRESRLLKAFSVRGIHVEPSGSPSSNGGVVAEVHPYIEGES